VPAKQAEYRWGLTDDGVVVVAGVVAGCVPMVTTGDPSGVVATVASTGPAGVGNGSGRAGKYVNVARSMTGGSAVHVAASWQAQGQFT